MENKRLFIDDFEIESKQNLKRRFHPPEKIGTVLQPDQPWEDKSGLCLSYGHPRSGGDI